MTIPSLEPIADAVRAVRAECSDAAELAADILAGDTQALDVGRELLAALDQLAAYFAGLGGSSDHVQIEQLIGVVPVVDAVLVAIGEQEHGDPEINERFKAVRTP